MLVRLNVVPPILPAMSVTIDPNLMTAIVLNLKLNKKGADGIKVIDLTEEEKSLLKKSADAITEQIKIIKDRL